MKRTNLVVGHWSMSMGVVAVRAGLRYGNGTRGVLEGSP